MSLYDLRTEAQALPASWRSRILGRVGATNLKVLRMDAHSVAYLPKGGFTRSSVLTQSNSTSNILDPNLKIGVGDPKEGDIDLLVRNKPTGDKGYNTGVDGTIAIGDGKDSAGWRRTWRQITNLPSTLM